MLIFRVPAAVAIAALAIVGTLSFMLSNPRGALIVFAGAYALSIIAGELWGSRHKIADALKLD